MAAPMRNTQAWRYRPTTGGETVVEEEKEGSHGCPNEEHIGMEVQAYNRGRDCSRGREGGPPWLPQ